MDQRQLRELFHREIHEGAYARGHMPRAREDQVHRQRFALVRTQDRRQAAGEHKLADKVLRLMEDSLARQDFLAAPRPTLADLACYAYIAHAPEGGVSLADYPQVRNWIARIQALPHFIPMPE